MGSTTIRFGAGDSRNSGIASFVSQTSVFNPMGTEANATPSSRIPDIGVFEQYHGFQFGEPANFSRSPMFNSTFTSQTVSPNLQGGTFPTSLATKNTNFSVALPEYQALQTQNGLQRNLASSSVAQHENWGESNMADSGSHSDTSTDADGEDKNQRSTAVGGSDSSDKTKEKKSDQKTLRRLAQNREAARKSRMRKKAYVQQLENSRLKLTQLEQELQRARQQGVFISNSSTGDQSPTGSGAMAFDVEYARWIEEQNKQINELRTAVNSHASDTELRPMVDNVTAHFNDIFRVKANAAKTDVFHILSGMWKTPSERCFMWIGGFRPSELLKLLVNQLEPLTEQQLTGIYNLQQTSTQAEDALSQGMEALQQSLAETLANGEGSSGNVANYMGQMAMAMGKLGTLEGFLHQADNLRQQTLQQMHRVLTTRQSARALLLIHDYFARLRALSSLWLARPRE